MCMTSFLYLVTKRHCIGLCLAPPDVTLWSRRVTFAFRRVGGKHGLTTPYTRKINDGSHGKPCADHVRAALLYYGRGEGECLVRANFFLDVL